MEEKILKPTPSVGSCFQGQFKAFLVLLVVGVVVYSISQAWGLIVFALMAFNIYFLPSNIALERNHKSKIPIVLLNLFFGVTVIAWIILLVWCCSDSVNPIYEEKEEEKEAKEEQA